MLSGCNRLKVFPVRFSAIAVVAITRNRLQSLGRMVMPPTARARRRRSPTG